MASKQLAGITHNLARVAPSFAPIKGFCGKAAVYTTSSASTLPLDYLKVYIAPPTYHRAFHTSNTVTIMSTFYDLKAGLYQFSYVA
jgi:hypothetical protein